MTETTDEASRPTIKVGATVLDTPDPRGLAGFYAELLGWRLDPGQDGDDWTTIRSADGEQLQFQLAEAFTAPTWPDPAVPQQFHLDLMVDDLDEGEAYAVSLGAIRRPSADEEPTFRVFLDPSGHPFCLCQAH